MTQSGHVNNLIVAARKEIAQPAGRLAGRALGTRLGTGSREKPIRHYEDKNLFVVISIQRLLVIHAAGQIPLSATGGSSAVGVHWFPD